MKLEFDKSAKNKNELVLEKRVPLRVFGKSQVYLMTNDFNIIIEKLKSFQCRIPTSDDFIEDPSLANNVRIKMQDLKANWALIISNTPALNYLDPITQKSYTINIKNLSHSDDKWTFIKIFQYIKDNNIDGIKEIVLSGYDIEQYIGYGFTPLMFAVLANKPDVVKTLLELGADINATDINGCTPLMYALKNESFDVVDILLSDKNIDLEKKDNTGSTALFKLIDGFNPIKIIYDMTYSKTSCLDVLFRLHKAGANINAINYSGESVLTYSIIKQSSPITVSLIHLGADVNYANKMGQTPLIIASQFGTESSINFLIEAGAKSDFIDCNNNTAFLAAVKNNKYKNVEVLINNFEIKKEEYSQAVTESVMHGFVDTTDILLKNAKDQKEMTYAALISACHTDNPNIIHICMDYDCNINETWYFDMTPLMIACYENATKTVAQLLAYGADINKSDQDGITALMYAASKNNSILIKYLIQNDANINLKDNNNKTFEDYTSIYDSRTFTTFFIERGKKLTHKEQRPDNIPNTIMSFGDCLNWYKQKYWERFPDKKEPDIYNNGGISKQTYSKNIKECNRNPDYHPKKDTVLKFALGLQLKLNEAETLLHSAGYTFTERDKKDIEIKSLLREGNYEREDWSVRLYNITGKAFFDALIEREEK
ncbi:Ankyrin repeat [Treponema bryantii]|uniref:Ankyrin repeat n=1 Tax=Treponema bryantii TaxID=163 RepID=A0A1I3LQ32_9SPIR|nr:ankyrin repeat domain-containing protein [Treponema bryantii]SFI86615.1 Ankyrin repeat [Treponema bryantii]